MNADFVAHCLELLAPLGALRARRMFGGHGIYAEEVFIALISEDRLYLKVDDLTRARFVVAACMPFSYTVKGGERRVLGFFTPPEEAMDAPPLMLPWARLAFEAALRAKAASDTAPSSPQAQPRARGASLANPAANRRKTRTKRPV
jgi:DNA transformation protein and related proteins